MDEAMENRQHGNGHGHRQNGNGQPDYATRMDIRELERQVERGSMFTQATIQRSFARIQEAEVLLTRLIETLTAKGVVTEREIGVKWEDLEGAPDPSEGPAPIPSPFAPTRPAVPAVEPDGELPIVDPGSGEPTGITWPAISIRVDNPEGLLDPEPEIDCNARMHVCHAVCCSLKFPLSEPEIDSGVVKWDIGHPYIIRHDSSGMCVHNEHETGGCTVYNDRPRICRRYSCVSDRRIWKDFDNMVLNEEWIAEHLQGGRIRVGAVVPSVDEPEVWSPGNVFGEDAGGVEIT